MKTNAQQTPPFSEVDLTTSAASTERFLSGHRAWLFLAALVTVSAVCQIDRMLPFILAESIKADLRINDTLLGLISGTAFSLCFSLMSFPLARFADRGSPRFVLVACILVWSIMTSLGSAAQSAGSLAFTRIGVALGEAGATPCSHALISRRIAPERRGRAIGLFAVGVPLGAMLGFAVGGWFNDNFGWRTALFLAGAATAILALLLPLCVGRTRSIEPEMHSEPSFGKSSLNLLSSPGFIWLFVAANAVGLASAPFYLFASSFLIRTYGLTASEVGVSFGALQGFMGLLGAMIAGRLFDASVKAGRKQMLLAPGLVLLFASFTTSAALFAPSAKLSLLLFVPLMFAFSFMLPLAFGTAHLVSGHGRQATASSLLLIGSGVLGPTLGPFTVGMISDNVTAASASNGLAWGLLLVPLASLLSAMSILIANHKVAEFLRADRN